MMLMALKTFQHESCFVSVSKSRKAFLQTLGELSRLLIAHVIKREMKIVNILCKSFHTHGFGVEKRAVATTQLGNGFNEIAISLFLFQQLNFARIRGDEIETCCGEIIKH